MRKLLLVLVLLSLTPMILAEDPPEKPVDWRAKVAEAMPLLGHRNWILIVDSAYPLQSAPGIETIETNAGEMEVVHHVLSEIDRSIHVRPLVWMDAELHFVPEDDAPGVSRYRTEISDMVRAYPIQYAPHASMLATVDDASKHFSVLILKTNMAIPYTSVFLQLDCKYWSADAEKRMRAKMAAAPQPAR